MVFSDGENLNAATFSNSFVLPKMKSLLLLYCVYTWCLGFSVSIHITPTDIENEKQELNLTKYVYSAEPSANLSNIHYYYHNTIGYPEINVTSAVTDTHNMDSVGHSENYGNSRSILDLDANQLTTKIPDTVDFSVLSEEFLNCAGHLTVEPELYEVFPNLSVYVPLYKRMFNTSDYTVGGGLLFICPDFFPPTEDEESISSNIDNIVSIVGTAISSICIILHLLMFCVTEKLRNLPGYCLVSLCISLLATYTNSFIQMKIHDQADCKVIGIFRIYSLLSSFFWMNVISFDVWYAIRLATCSLRLNTRRSMIFRFSMYSLYAWGIPLLFMIFAIIVDSVSESEKYSLTFLPMTCWFKNKTALLLYFAIPVFIVFVINIIFFISSFVMITRTRSDSGSNDSYDLRSQLFLSLRLGSAMGLMWIFGVIGSMTQAKWIVYLHAACTALQGVFIFFSFTVNEKTKNACKKFMDKKMSVISQQTTITQ